MDTALEEEMIARELEKHLIAKIARVAAYIETATSREMHFTNRDWNVEFYVTPYNPGSWAVTGVKRITPVHADQRHTALPPQPPAHAPEPDDPTGAKAKAADAAIAALWPDGIREDITAKTRDNQIMDHCKANGEPVSLRTVKAAVARARLAA